MKLLILTQYYPPETGAAQNRLHALAKRLSNNGVKVQVLTAMPNYPQMRVFKGYRSRLFKQEEIDGIEVLRSWIFVKNSKSILLRLINYFSFVITALFAGIFGVRKANYILCESPPLFLGITAYILSRLKRAKLIFNVSDLWPESAEKLGLISSPILLNMSRRLEEFLYRKSVLVSGQTKGIVENISNRFPAKRVYWLPNGAELEYYLPDKRSGSWRADNGFDKNDILAFYGGILGHAQGLEVILLTASILKENTGIKFIIMGSGPCKDDLLVQHAKMGLNNVFFFDTVQKERMPEVLSAIDFSIIPLKKIDLFKGAIPSKIFESLAMKKPILLGVEGEAKDLFIDEGQCGLAFTPEDHHELAEKVLLLSSDKDKRIEMGNAARAYVEQKFDRNKIADNFHQVLLGLKQ